MTWELHHGDALDDLRRMEDSSADALVTDPPAGIGFMGAEWDKDKGGRGAWVAWLTEILRECRRVLKPGAHALVWALPRTAHWTAWAVEDAGFEVRDTIAHLFGQGFPKSHNLDGEWEGWGTALKPAREDWILARKPLCGTVAANVREWGTGALNIDGCRIGDNAPVGATKGRFPANLTLDEEAAAALDAQSGTTSVTGCRSERSRNRKVEGTAFLPADHRSKEYPGDAGGASRFFYVAKPSRREKEAGCEHLPRKTAAELTGRAEGSAGLVMRHEDGSEKANPYAGTSGAEPRANHHPTVKPVALMRYLCRLVTPPGGLVLDPFAGSGTTGVGALLEGFRFVGVERDESYATIARARLTHASRDESQASLFA
jgi:DNA modification methylase